MDSHLRRPPIDNRLFLLGLCMMACAADPAETVTFTGGTGGGDDDDDTTTTGDPPSPTASAGSTAPTSSTPTTDASDTGTTAVDPSETTMSIDPTDTAGGSTDAGSTSATGGTTGDTTSGTTTDGTTSDTGNMDLPCGPYASAYALCYYPDDLPSGYSYGLYFCQYYAGDCYGISDECDALFDEWIACVSALDCAEYELPPCPTELDTLQTTCMCGAG